METTPLLEKKRYHDLDALRAVAMLLGILLHGAISFMREPFWPIQDSQSLFWGMPEGMQEVGASMGMELPKQFSPYKFFFMQLVHGFRMPLFFVASGFFAAMLWRQRARLPDQQLHRASTDHRPTLSRTLADRTVLQMDQATPAHQGLSRHQPERGQNADMDCDLDLRAGRHHQKRTQLVGQPLPNPTGCQCHHFRASAHSTGSSATTYRRKIGLIF